MKKLSKSLHILLLVGLLPLSNVVFAVKTNTQVAQQAEVVQVSQHEDINLGQEFYQKLKEKCIEVIDRIECNRQYWLNCLNSGNWYWVMRSPREWGVDNIKKDLNKKITALDKKKNVYFDRLARLEKIYKDSEKKSNTSAWFEKLVQCAMEVPCIKHIRFNAAGRQFALIDGEPRAQIEHLIKALDHCNMQYDVAKYAAPNHFESNWYKYAGLALVGTAAYANRGALGGLWNENIKTPLVSFVNAFDDKTGLSVGDTLGLKSDKGVVSEDEHSKKLKEAVKKFTTANDDTIAWLSAATKDAKQGFDSGDKAFKNIEDAVANFEKAAQKLQGAERAQLKKEKVGNCRGFADACIAKATGTVKQVFLSGTGIQSEIDRMNLVIDELNKVATSFKESGAHFVGLSGGLVGMRESANIRLEKVTKQEAILRRSSGAAEKLAEVQAEKNKAKDEIKKLDAQINDPERLKEFGNGGLKGFGGNLDKAIEAVKGSTGAINDVAKIATDKFDQINEKTKFTLALTAALPVAVALWYGAKYAGKFAGWMLPNGAKVALGIKDRDYTSLTEALRKIDLIESKNYVSLTSEQPDIIQGQRIYYLERLKKAANRGSRYMPENVRENFEEDVKLLCEPDTGIGAVTDKKAVISRMWNTYDFLKMSAKAA